MKTGLSPRALLTYRVLSDLPHVVPIISVLFCIRRQAALYQRAFDWAALVIESTYCS